MGDPQQPSPADVERKGQPMIDIEAARKLCAEATPGPFAYVAGAKRYEVRTVTAGSGELIASRIERAHDAAFIAAARTLLPAALDELEQLRGEVANLRADLHNTARGHAPFNGTEFAAAMRECERETADEIAAWLDAVEDQDGCGEGMSAGIRAGVWRTK